MKGVASKGLASRRRNRADGPSGVVSWRGWCLGAVWAFAPTRGDEIGMATITKKDLFERVADRTGIKRPLVRESVQEFLDQIIAELKKGNRLEFRDFGVFEIKERAARRAQNPKTLEQVLVPAKKTVKFKIGRLMRDSVEGVPAMMTEAKPEARAKSVAR